MLQVVCFSMALATLVPFVGLTPASVPESLVQEVVELVVARMERKAQLELLVRLELVEDEIYSTSSVVEPILDEVVVAVVLRIYIVAAEAAVVVTDHVLDSLVQ